jgi:hypothetical protein
MKCVLSKGTMTALAGVGIMLATAMRSPQAQAKDYGACSSSSDCHTGVSCRDHKCADGPGGTCVADADCGKGSWCSDHKCTAKH